MISPVLVDFNVMPIDTIGEQQVFHHFRMSGIRANPIRDVIEGQPPGILGVARIRDDLKVLPEGFELIRIMAQHECQTDLFPVVHTTPTGPAGGCTMEENNKEMESNPLSASPSSPSSWSFWCQPVQHHFPLIYSTVLTSKMEHSWFHVVSRLMAEVINEEVVGTFHCLKGLRHQAFDE